MIPGGVSEFHLGKLQADRLDARSPAHIRVGHFGNNMNRLLFDCSAKISEMLTERVRGI